MAIDDRSVLPWVSWVPEITVYLDLPVMSCSRTHGHHRDIWEAMEGLRCRRSPGASVMENRRTGDFWVKRRNAAGNGVILSPEDPLVVYLSLCLEDLTDG